MLSHFQKSKLKTQLSFNKDASAGFAKIPVSDKPSILKAFEKCSFEDVTKRSGRAWLAHCPFHDDAKTSFALYEDTQSYYCFGCGESGDSFELIKKSFGTDFMGAKKLAESWGI